MNLSLHFTELESQKWNWNKTIIQENRKHSDMKWKNIKENEKIYQKEV